jgi:hypothetical protein
MNRDQVIAILSLFVGIFGCMAAWLALPQIQVMIPSPRLTPTQIAQASNMPMPVSPNAPVPTVAPTPTSIAPVATPIPTNTMRPTATKTIQPTPTTQNVPFGKIAFHSQRNCSSSDMCMNVFVMNADGADLRTLANTFPASYNYNWTLATTLTNKSVTRLREGARN